MQRRTFFKLGVVGAAILALGGGLAVMSRTGLEKGKLTEAGRELFGAVAVAVLEGVLPAETRERHAVITSHLIRVEATIAGLPLRTQSELAQLLTILTNPAGRRFIAGLNADWIDASIQDLQAALQSMRVSSLALREQTYAALRNITIGAYFSEPSTWGPLGYPGPTTI